ncbi:MAG: CPBP family glutamic-type intramembrane protease [Promethearchaeota archaeon]
MSEEKNSKKKVKYCIYCGAEVDPSKIYCPNCGKLIVIPKPKSKEQQETRSQTYAPISARKTYEKRCSNCGSIISSPILEQCPICNAILEKGPKEFKQEAKEKESKGGIIFTTKKFVPEQKLTLKRDVWNIREGLSIFGNSIMAYIFIKLLIIMLFALQTPTYGTIPLNITTILLSQIPEIIFGVYPLWYIYTKRHAFKKLGFYSENRKILYAFIIGVIGAASLVFINIFSSIFIDWMYNSGIKIYDVQKYITEQNQVIQNSDVIWIILLSSLVSLSAFSTEIVFRGVFHNTLKSYFEGSITGRIYVIILVALTYSTLYLLFSLPIGIYFFLANFLYFLVLGVLYEINNNIYNTIVATIIYNIIIILIIYFNINIPV